MKFKQLITCTFFIALITSCDNTIKVLAPYKNITVVYGVLDQSDPIHYFRINKGFEGSGNAYAMAQQYDSIYYPINTISAYLQDSSPVTNAIINTYTLDTTTSIPLGPGTFSYPKQLLYYTTATLNPKDYYNLVIVNTKSQKKITGSVSLIPNISELSGYNNGLSFNLTAPTIIAWYTTPNVRIYQMTIRFYYHEIWGVDTAYKYLDWIFAPVISPTLYGGYLLSYSLNGQGLISLATYSIKPEADVKRYADSLDYIFTSGSDDLYVYQQLSIPPTGINQDVPGFSDMKNGVGLYTSRHVEHFYTRPDGQLIDSLITESATADLNFQR